jgi:predicted esterase
MHTHTIETRTHGRYLVDVPVGAGPLPVLVGFHGYKENADHMLAALVRIRGEHAWLLVSVQALSRFYDRTQQIVGSWMTRQDRDLAIADNIAYAASVIAAVRLEYSTTNALVCAGFSQGVAMAYRAAAFAGPATGAVMLAGDVPPDVAPVAATLPPVLIGRGMSDEWYSAGKGAADQQTLRTAGVRVEEHVFDAGHVWDATFIERARAFVSALPGF